MQDQNKKLIVVSAPSGAGKSTIVKELMKDDSLKLEFSVSACTRQPREGEKEGEHYYFLSPDIFRQKVDQGLFLEWEEVYENQFYGTFKSEVERIWKKGKNVVFDIDVAGGLNIKKQYPGQTLTIFIKPPDINELERRLRKRGTENDESLKRRLGKALQEMAAAPAFDKVVVNDALENAIEECRKLIFTHIKAL